MKKKVAAIVIFIVVLVFPMVTWPMLFPLDKTQLDENRNPTPFPKFDNEFFINFDKFFTEHLPFRNDYIKLYSNFDVAITKLYSSIMTSMGISNYTSKNNVLFGKEDWLFYLANNSLAYYTGNNLPKEQELAKMVQNAEKINNYFISQGKEFKIFIAPNKEQIYSEYMPDGIVIKNDIKRMDIIIDYFQKHSNVEIIYPKQELLKAKENMQIYYKYDTHWNEGGGYFGSRALLNSLNIPVGDAVFSEKEYWDGDLIKLLGSDAKVDVGYDIIYRPEISVNVEIPNENFICSSTNTNGKNLFLLGDSFRWSMSPVLSKEFTSSYLYASTSLSYEKTFEEEFSVADTIIFESVERFESSRLLDLMEKFIKIYKL